MFTVLVFLLFGILFGFLFRKKNKIIIIADKSLIWSIYLLLFLLGIAIGSNKTILQNFADIGFKFIILSLAGTISSILLAWIVYKFFWKKNEE
jgi:uncharacterized membrane protein YbjE (DUF340 family)